MMVFSVRELGLIVSFLGFRLGLDREVFSLYTVPVSVNRENIIWKSGEAWYIGFFACFVVGEDYEWDVEYDFSSFQWASGPHKSCEEARDAWRGANPGGHVTDIDGGEKYDAMFCAYIEEEKKRRSTL